ncbi:uncharacterized protein N7482_000557 [Penicillium canariense]|uniref:Aminodeoxychorismate lyase n=1 Tax=Penicillium canariense TaxID=189055 RepID=A0A9W9LSR6_9EURO|nr:uncharacterized protein N7482_000557 [Penicillium canariense]KAJ5174680.1 hypothetical protein N7482_000557 [Penicillium canariense]
MTLLTTNLGPIERTRPCPQLHLQLLCHLSRSFHPFDTTPTFRRGPSRNADTDSYPAPAQSPYYLLPYHRDRLISAAHHFKWASALDFLQQDLESFEEFLDASIPDRDKPWRLRIVVDCNGTASVDVNPTAAIDPLNLLIPSPYTDTQSTIWQVYVDSQSITPSGFTTHKTTARDEYTAARMRAGISSPMETSEVLVVNPDGEIMEGSISTPFFRRRNILKNADKPGPVWMTPPLTSGGNAGTTRRYALTHGFCVEEVITRADLVDGEECWLSNGVRGFMHGVVVLSQ